MASAEALSIQHSIASGSSTPFHRLDRPDDIATQLPIAREGNILDCSSSSGADLSRLLSIRRKQSSTPSDHLRAITVVRREEVVVSEPLPPVSSIAAPSDTADANIGIVFPADSARAASQSHSGSGLDRSRSLLSTSMPSLGCSSTRRRRQQSPSVSGQPKGTLPSTKSIHDSTSALHALDLNKSNACMSSASASRRFPSFFMKGLRHTRARTEGAQLDLTEQITSYRKAGWRSRKISLSGLNLLKTPLNAADAPSTPEIETWKQKEAVQRKSEEASLHYFSRGNEAGIHRRECGADKDETQYTMTTNLSTDGDKGGVNCAPGFDSIGLACAEKSSQTRGKRRKPMTPLDLSAIAAAEATLDSPLPSFHDNYRPYSLISTDIEGNETPIVRLQKLIVDTNEGDEDQEEESRLFFRPVQAEDACISRSGLNFPEEEVIQDQHDTNVYPDRSSAGLFLAEQSDPCSGSDTLTTRRLSSQKHGEGDDSQLSASARRILKFYQMGFDDDNQLQYQQRQPPRLPSTSRFGPSGPATSLTSASLSIEIKRESIVSSRSDSSVNEAILSRATSTRLQSVPLRRIRREDLAHQPAQDDKRDGDVRDSDKRGMTDAFDGMLSIPGVATSSKSHIGSQPPSGLNSKAAKVSLGKEAKSSQQTFSEGLTAETSPSERSRAKRVADRADSQAGKAAHEDAVETQRTTKDDGRTRKRQGRHATRRRSRDEDATGKKEKHRRRHSRQSSQKKSYLTSEAAATAKRKEQEDREERSRQRRQKKELARQEAYAEKKRNDPLLKMRLALVGLATADESKQVQTSRETCEELQPVQHSTDSTPMHSKASFHTAEEEEEEEEMADGLALSKPAREVHFQQHQRNQASTASSTTVVSHSEASSIGTLTNTFIPQPPLRLVTPIKADDGTILARARMPSRDASSYIHEAGIDDDLTAIPKAIASQSDFNEDATMVLLSGSRIRLSQGASMQNLSASVKYPGFVDELQMSDREGLAHLRRSFVPEVCNRFSLQSFVD